jgi:hypothetical protein
MTRQIVTASRLADGRVAFRAAEGWSTDVRDALTFSADEAAAAITRAQGEPTNVVGAYAVDVDDTGLPLLGRERIRVFGPTVAPYSSVEA